MSNKKAHMLNLLSVTSLLSICCGSSIVNLLRILKRRRLCVHPCLSVCLFVSVCLSGWLAGCLAVCLCVWNEFAGSFQGRSDMELGTFWNIMGRLLNAWLDDSMFRAKALEVCALEVHLDYRYVECIFTGNCCNNMTGPESLNLALIYR